LPLGLRPPAAAAKRAKKKPLARKLAAKRKDAPEQSDDEQEHGLWVNTEFFRSLTRRSPRTIVHPSTLEEQNYYLGLADIILGPAEKRKTDRRATAFLKASALPKKHKSK